MERNLRKSRVGLVVSDKMDKTITVAVVQKVDMQNRIVYFRTMYNSAIRSIDLNTIDFSSVQYHAKPLDRSKQQPIESIMVK